MASTLGCIGLDVSDTDDLVRFVERVAPTVRAVSGRVITISYIDASGARLTVGLREGDAVDMVPSFDAPLGARLSGLSILGEVATADVLEDGELLTRLVGDLEQRPVLLAATESGATSRDAHWPAAVVALGTEMEIHADATAFGSSDASILAQPETGREPHRWGPTSFVSYGLFGSGDTDPYAFLAGIVLDAETRTNQMSGQVFHVARVQTAGFTASICLAASEHPVAPLTGNVVAGRCYLVVDVPDLWSLGAPTPRRRRLFGRRR